MQNHQAPEMGSGRVVDCFHDRLLLLESISVVILREVYCLFFSASTMSRNHPSDEVGKSYTHPVGCQFPKKESENQVLSRYLLLSGSCTGSQVGESERWRHIAPPLRLSAKAGSNNFLGGNRLCCPAKEQSWSSEGHC